MDEEKLLSGKELTDKIAFFRRKIDENIINIEKSDDRDIAYLFEYENFMREQGLYSKEEFGKLNEYIYSKLPENEEKELKKLSAILEYRALVNTHILETLNFLKQNNSHMDSDNKCKKAVDAATEYLDSYLDFYFPQEGKNYGIGYMELKQEVLNNKAEDIMSKIREITEYHGMDSKKIIDTITERATSKYNSSEFMIAALKYFDELFETKKIVKPTQMMNHIISSYENLSKSYGPKEFESRAKCLVNACIEFEYFDCLENIITATVNVNYAFHLAKQLDGDFGKNMIKYDDLHCTEKDKFPQKEVVTKDYIEMKLDETSDILDNLFYLNLDESATDLKLSQETNKIQDKLYLVKKIVEKGRTPYNVKYDSVADEIDSRLKNAMNDIAVVSKTLSTVEYH